MRITTNTITRNYLRNLQNNNKLRFESENRVTSGAKYSRGSQDPMTAARALAVRKNFADLKTYRDNLGTADNIYASAETVVLEISDKLTSYKERALYAVNASQSQTEKDIIAKEIEGYADQMVKLFNTAVAGRQLFGGENNSNLPFTTQLEPDGSTTVLYNGEAVNSKANADDFPYSNKVLIDVGLGFRVDENGIVDPQSALQISFNGAELTGHGLDEEGYSQNYIQLMYDTAKALRAGDDETTKKLIDKVESTRNHVSITIANIGNAQRFIEFNLDKITKEEYNLTDKQIDYEATDMAEELTYYKVLSATYSATLQMSASIVPMSIFNFIS